MAASDVTQADAEGTFDGAFDTAKLDDAVEVIESVVGVKPRLEDNYDLGQLDLGDRVQIRLDKNNAPKEMVERFAFQMGRSVFPPPVITADHRVVDGNTRIRARALREERFSSAYVVPISWDEADENMRARLEFLGYLLNNSNGLTLDRAERRQMVRDGLRLGMTARQISQTTGFKPSVVSAVNAEIRGEERIRRVGLEELVEAGRIRDASLRALGKAPELNDEPFRSLVELTADAGFNVGEIRALGSSLKEAGSDELALERASRERDANAQRIADRARGGNGHPPAARLLRQRLGFITSRDVDVLVETNPERMRDHLEAVNDAIAVLEQVRDAQAERLEAVS